jgi:hypothetical protein
MQHLKGDQQPFICTACQAKVAKHLNNRKTTFQRQLRTSSPFAKQFQRLVSLMVSFDFMRIPAQVRVWH